MPSVDTVVVGAGVVGLACARELARRGRRVAVLERDVIGTTLGSSWGDARMRVPAAFPTDDYLLRGLRAGEGWRDLEAETGETLLVETGCLSWGDGQEALAASLDTHGQRYELLTAAEAERAHPGLRMPADAVAIAQDDAQTVLADRALACFAAAASAAGALVRERVAVEEIAVGADRAQVSSSDGDWACGHVVIAAGAWTPWLLDRLGLALEARTTLQTVSYFDAAPATTRVGLIEYGAPDPYALWSPSGRKAAEHRFGPVTHPEAARAPEAAALARTREWVADRFGAGVAGRRTAVQTCLYTVTPDEGFVIEAHGRVVVVSACSGQGFQYAPDTGRRVADLIES